MTGKNKGEWPYHEDPHGNWVACSSNPCKLHSGGDIMATSPEDAFAKAHADDNAGGMTSDAGVQDGNREPIFGRLRLHAHRKVMDKKVAGLITPPVENVNEPGDEFFEGGRYQETRNMSQEDVADLIRADVRNLKKAGAVPSDWDVSVKSGGEKFRIIIDPGKSRIKPFRKASYEDITHEEKDGGNHFLRQAYLDETHDDSYSETGAKTYLRNSGRITEATTELKDAEHYIGAAAGQYGQKTRNSEQYFDQSTRMSQIELKR